MLRSKGRFKNSHCKILQKRFENIIQSLFLKIIVIECAQPIFQIPFYPQYHYKKDEKLDYSSFDSDRGFIFWRNNHMKVLAVCATVFQMLGAISLKNKVYKYDMFSLVLMDTIIDCQDYAERIRYSGIFSEVVVFNTHLGTSVNGKKLKIHHLIPILDFWKGNGILNDYHFDVLLGGNIYWVMDIYFNRINNKKLQVYLLEDGICNYLKDTMNKFYKPSFKDCFKHDILKNLRGQYVFSPDICYFNDIKLPSFRIPSLDEIEKELLNFIFNYSAKTIYPRVIYLEQYFEDKEFSMRNQEFIDILKNELGQDGFAVKMHPRSNLERIKELRCNTIIDRTPLELILINSNTIDLLISIYSAASITPITALNKKVKSILLFKLRENEINRIGNVKELIESMESMSSFNSDLIIVDSLNEFSQVIRHYVKKEKYE